MPVQSIDDARIARFTPQNLGVENRERLRIALEDRLIDDDELATGWALLQQTTQGTPHYDEAERYARTLQTMYVDQHMRGAIEDGRTARTLGAFFGIPMSPFDDAGSRAYRKGLNEGGLMSSLSAMPPRDVAYIVDNLIGLRGAENPDFSRRKLANTMTRYEGHIPLNQEAVNQLWSSLQPQEQTAFGTWLTQNARRAPR